MHVQIESDRLSPDQLRNVVLGKDRSISRIEAMACLKHVDLPDKFQIIERVLKEESDDASMRALAVMTLYQLGLPENQGILVTNSQYIQNEQVLGSIATVLGRTGDEQALETVIAIEKRTEGRIAAQARFATQLLAHRLGLQLDF